MTKNAKGTRDTQRYVMTLKEQLALNAIVVARYAKSGLNNADFASTINQNPDERAKFKGDVNPGHIMTALTAAEIPNNMRIVSPFAEKTSVLLRIQRLEEQVSKLMEKLHA
jgi:hypothetical protein